MLLKTITINMNKQEVYDIINDMKNEIIQSIEIEREVEYFETREVIQCIEELSDKIEQLINKNN